MKDLESTELIELLNKCWMTHDGMWFFHCFQEFGIEKVNKLNRSAIKSLAPIEVKRIKKAVGMEDAAVKTFEEFRMFFSGAMRLCMPDFMNISMSFPNENTIHWEFEPGKCFAYLGMQRIGAIEEYNCGVIYRVESWIESLCIKYSTQPSTQKCLMLDGGECVGDITLIF